MGNATITQKASAAVEASDEIGVLKIIELAIGYEQLGLRTGDKLNFHVTVHKEGFEIERWPRNGYIEIPVPDEDFEASMWCV